MQDPPTWVHPVWQDPKAQVPVRSHAATQTLPEQLLLPQSLAPRQPPAAVVQLTGHDPNVLQTRGWVMGLCFTRPDFSFG